MQKAIINVGLMVGNSGHAHNAQKVTFEITRRLGVKVLRQLYLHSNTEPTLVAELARPLTAQELWWLCGRFKQEAIAQHNGIIGELHGPKAAKWGPFNPDFFLAFEAA